MRIRIVAVSLLMTAVLLGLLGCGGSDTPKAPAVAVLRTGYGSVLYEAAWVAFQDGTGAWKPLVSKSPGYYTAPVTDAAGRFGFAVVSPTAADLPRVTIYQSTLAETPVITHRFSSAMAGTASLTGTFTGAPVGSTSVNLAVGPYIATVNPMDPYHLAGMETGIYDLVALRRNLSPGAVTSIYTLRGLGVSGDSTLNIDFTNINFATTSPLSYKLYLPVTATGRVDLVTPNHTVAQVSDIGVMSGDPVPYVALPTAYQHTNDLYVAHAESNVTAGTMYTRQSTNRAYHTPATKSVSLPALFNSAYLHLVGTRMTLGWTPYPNALGYHVKIDPTAGNTWSVWLSSGWLGGNFTNTYTVPAFNSFATWKSAWDPTGGEQQWLNEAFVSNHPLQDVLNAVTTNAYVDGMQIDTAGSGWTRLE
jgi:hypothetical protein